RPLLKVRPAEIGQRQPNRQPRLAILRELQVLLDGHQIFGIDQPEPLVDEGAASSMRLRSDSSSGSAKMLYMMTLTFRCSTICHNVGRCSMSSRSNNSKSEVRPFFLL